MVAQAQLWSLLLNTMLQAQRPKSTKMLTTRSDMAARCVSLVSTHFLLALFGAAGSLPFCLESPFE